MTTTKKTFMPPTIKPAEPTETELLNLQLGAGTTPKEKVMLPHPRPEEEAMMGPGMAPADQVVQAVVPADQVVQAVPWVPQVLADLEGPVAQEVLVADPALECLTGAVDATKTLQP